MRANMPLLLANTMLLANALLPAAALAEGGGRAAEMEAAFMREHEHEMAASRQLIASGNAPLDLVMLTDAQSKDRGAVCLDGTNPGFYMTKGTGTGANKWVLYFKGGGWCYNEASCASRTKTSIGSAKLFTPTFAFSGPMDSNATVNPTFANYNRVVLWYCDGASFSGDADAVNHKTEVPLYFRGRRILDAMLDTLKADHGLDTAEEVLLSGGSAGGLAAYLHTDYVASQLPPSVKKFKSSPVSGFFLLHDDAAGTPLYPNEMEYVFNMQNSTGGVNAKCIASLPQAEQWRCIFANYSYAHVESPIFPLNSAIDAWQMGNARHATPRHAPSVSSERLDLVACCLLRS